MKFGCDPTYEAPSLLRLARLLDLDVIGISFHVGSGCQDPPVFNRAICHAKNLFNLASDIGFKPYLLDLGGGYPGDKGTSIDKIADVINHALDEHFPCMRISLISPFDKDNHNHICISYYKASLFNLKTR
jgi:ornithine decarboxylase